jgi:hypothetical protein
MDAYVPGRGSNRPSQIVQNVNDLNPTEWYVPERSV